jgi:hypothetical protein
MQSVDRQGFFGPNGQFCFHTYTLPKMSNEYIDYEEFDLQLNYIALE